jgi:hypothetical protein
LPVIPRLRSFQTEKEKQKEVEMEAQLLGLLHGIVCHAARLSLLLRLDGETIYYMPFTPKDETRAFCDTDGTGCVTYFDKEHGERMLSDAENPLQTISCEENKLTQEMVYTIWHTWQEFVRIICFDRVEAYRKGGWRPQDHQKGFRRREIAPARVAVRWGLQADWKAMDRLAEEKTDAKELPSTTAEQSPKDRKPPTQAVKRRPDIHSINFIQLRDCIRNFDKMHPDPSNPWYAQGELMKPDYAYPGTVIPGTQSRKPENQNLCDPEVQLASRRTSVQRVGELIGGVVRALSM